MKKIFRLIYEKLFKINDTPQKIALGFGIGLFAGIFPGTGPVAAIFLALLLRTNRASTLIGVLATNTWLSFLVFPLSLQIGSVILKTDWRAVYNESLLFLQNFRWLNLFQLSFLKIILPMIIGYTIIGLVLGLAGYLATLITFKRLKHENKS